MQLLEIFRPREQVPRFHQTELTLNNIRSDSEPKELLLKEFDEYDEYDEYEYRNIMGRNLLFKLFAELICSGKVNYVLYLASILSV